MKILSFVVSHLREPVAGENRYDGNESVSYLSRKPEKQYGFSGEPVTARGLVGAL